MPPNTAATTIGIANKGSCLVLLMLARQTGDRINQDE